MADAVYEMMKNMSKKNLSSDDVATLLVMTSILLGGWFRIFPAFLAGFPVNDGGMFYTMIEDLQMNHYLLPFYTSYNNLNIPFAYPPLAFYVGAIISDVLHISPVEIVRWLPGITSTFCVLAFFFTAKELMESRLVAAAATLIFALIPHMSDWNSMGGGLTRSFGMLFMILTVLYAYRLFTKNIRYDPWRTILFGSLTILSHPESIVYTVGICTYIWFMKSRTLKAFLDGILVSLAVLMATAPWYGLILYRHGFETLLSAMQTGGHSVWSPLIILNMDSITAEPYLDLLGVLGVLGIITLVIRRQYFVPGMLAVIYLIGPRSAHTVGNISFALAGGFFLMEIIIPTLSDIGDDLDGKPSGISRRTAVILAVFTVPYLLCNSTYNSSMISQNHVDEQGRTDMRWVAENTPRNSRFLVLTGNPDGMCDSLSEWFPALAQRTSLTTIQGREWLLGNEFDIFAEHRANIQDCIDEGLECLDGESGYFGEDYDYVYISTAPPIGNCKFLNTPRKNVPALVIALEDDAHYPILYRSENVVIFRKTG